MNTIRIIVLGAVVAAFFSACRGGDGEEPPIVPQCFINFDDVSPSDRENVEEAFREGSFIVPDLTPTSTDVKGLTTILKIIHKNYIIDSIPTKQLPFLDPHKRVTHYTIYNLPSSLVANERNENCFPETTIECSKRYVMDVTQDAPQVFRYFFCYTHEQLRLVSVGQVQPAKK